jgi:hypothetical protein
MRKLFDDSDTNIEIWKDLKNLDRYDYHYQVSSFGRIQKIETKDSLINRTILSTHETSEKGYTQVWLYKNGKRTAKYIHRLVCSVFIDEVNHKDENPRNNHLSNLEWSTRSHNTKNKKHSNKRKLTGKEAGYVKDSKESLNSLARKFNVSTMTIKQIKENKTYKEEIETRAIRL